MVVGRQPNAPAAFTPGEIPGTHFQSGHMVLSGVQRKKSPVTPPGIDPGTVRLVAQRLNHYATPDHIYMYIYISIYICTHTHTHTHTHCAMFERHYGVAMTADKF